mgnify:FL=1
MYIRDKWFFKTSDNKLFNLIDDNKMVNCNIIAKELPANNGVYKYSYNACLSVEDFVNVSKTDKHIYELLRGECRCLYLDSDCCKLHPITEELFLDVIKRLIVLLNEQQITLVYDDITIKINHDFKSVGVKSFHIIVKKYCMEFLQMKELVMIINHLFRMEFPTFFDDGRKDKEILDKDIYTKNRLIRCLGQSKRKQKDLKINDYKFMLYDNDNKSKCFNDTIISDTTNSIKINYTNAYDVWKRKFAINHINDVATHKTLITISTDTECFKRSFELLGVNFWGNKSNWICATRIIYAQKLFVMDKWNKFSVATAKKYGLEYTEESNKDFIDSIDVNLVKSGVPLLTAIMNECSDEYVFLFDYDKYVDMRERVTAYIQHHNLSIVIPPPLKLTDEKVVTSDNFEVNYKNGFITDLLLENRLPKKHNKVNFGTDLINKKYDTLYPQFNIGTIDEIEPYVDDFIHNDKKALVVASKWATGKSAVVMMKMLKHIETIENTTDEIVNVLILTPNNAVACKLYEELKDIGFITHLKKSKKIDISVSSKLISSTQSLAKAQYTEFNYVFLDEFNMILSSYDSGNTFIKVCHPSPSYNILLKICKNAEKLVCMDADIEHDNVKNFMYALDTLNAPNKCFGKPIEVVSPTIPTFILNSQNKYKNYKFDIMLKEPKFKNAIHKRITDGNRIYVAFVSRKQADIFYNDLKHKFPDKNILKITKDGVMRSYDKTKTGKCKYIQKLEQNIMNECVDIFIYSPTICVGTSINATELFDYGFAYGIHTPLIAQQFLQQFFRVRNLSAQHVTILLEGRCWGGYDFKCDIQTARLKLMNVVLKKENDGGKINQYYTKKSNYYDLLGYIHYKKINSEKSFGRELLYLMNYHKLNYEFIYDDEVIPVVCKEFTGSSLTAEQEKQEFISAYKYDNYAEFKELDKKNKEDETILTHHQSVRLDKTKSLYYMNGVDDILKNLPNVKSIDQNTLNGFVKSITDNNDNDEFLYDYKNKHMDDMFKARRCYYQIKDTISAEVLFKANNGNVDNQNKEINNNTKIEEQVLFQSVYECLRFLNVIEVVYVNDELDIVFKDVKLLMVDFLKQIIENKSKIIKWITLHTDILYYDNSLRNFTDWINKFTIKKHYNKTDEFNIKSIYDTINSRLEILDLKFKCYSPTYTFMNNKYLRVYNNNGFLKHKKLFAEYCSNILKHLPNNHQYQPTISIKNEIDTTTNVNGCNIVKNYIEKSTTEDKQISDVKYSYFYDDDNVYFNNSLNNIHDFKVNTDKMVESRFIGDAVFDVYKNKYWYDKQQKKDRVRDIYGVEWYVNELPVVLYTEQQTKWVKEISSITYRPYPTYMISSKVKTIMNTKHITIQEPVDNSLDAYVECMVNDVIDDVVNQIVYRKVVLEPNIKNHPLVKQLPLLTPIVDEVKNNYMIMI